jgi:hypothetical protein
MFGAGYPVAGAKEVAVRSPSRRGVLLAAAGLAAVASAGAGYELVQDGTLPGKYQLAELTGACGSPPPAPAGPLPSQRVVSFFSAYRRRRVHMVTLIPAQAAARAGLRVVIALHGADSDALSMADQVRPAMASARVPGLAVICVDGGNTYWHRRADGDDPIGMILYEILPRARAAGMATSQIGIAGESMGGYGALLLAERLAAPGPVPTAPPSVAGVAALSPAIFGSYADARAADSAAFDGQADFSRNDVLTGIRALRGVPAWIACGSDDPFESEAAAFRRRLAAVTGHGVPGGILPGCHDDAFWERNLPAALRFLGAHLRSRPLDTDEGR